MRVYPNQYPLYRGIDLHARDSATQRLQGMHLA